ncbi:MAG TPA: polysaccharide biosynthesis/export family protein [Candidatus Acidoferrales bacterium]|nr:polysaccharide biosynthesis/export family protein [Candidatus Acidoferrales bacterium]
MGSGSRGISRLAGGCSLSFLLPIIAAGQAPARTQKLPQHHETTEQTNQRIREMATDSRAPLGDFRVGSGDVLMIEVFDVPELSREVRVSDAGFISLPLLPVRIQVNGLTNAQVEEKIAELLQANGLVSHPEVSVSIKEQHSQPITVVGAVRTPQVLQANRPIRLLEALSDAGGIADDAGNTVLLTRQVKKQPTSAASPEPQADGAPNSNAVAPQSAGDAPSDTTLQSETTSINLFDLLDRDDPKANVPLQAGDVVAVPRAGIVYVVGAVNHPGGFVLQADGNRMTSLKAVALAQGTAPTAKLGDAVILRKDLATGTTREIPVNLKRVMQRKDEDAALQPNDVFFVPDSAGKRMLHTMGTAALSMTTGVAIIRAGSL